MGFDFAGTYTKIVEHKLIEYSFGGRMAQVEFSRGPKGVGWRGGVAAPGGSAAARADAGEANLMDVPT